MIQVIQMINNDSSAYKITEDEGFEMRTSGGPGALYGNAAPAVAEPDAGVPDYQEPSPDEIYVYEQEKRRGNAVLHEIRLKKNRRKQKNGILLKVSILLILGLIVGVRFASITEINYRNQALQKQLDAVNADIQRRRVEMDSALSLTDIGHIAENELGMQKPQPYQVKYVTVDKIDQTELANVELTRTASEEAWYKKAWRSVLEFLGIIG